MIHREVLPISMEELTQDWNTWINDSSLQSTLRFGQYVINKRMIRCKDGNFYVWPDCFYADTGKAWELLFQWINTPSPASYPKLAYQ